MRIWSNLSPWSCRALLPLSFGPRVLKIFSWPPDICIYLRFTAIFDPRTFYFEARGCLRMLEKLWIPNQIQPVGSALVSIEVASATKQWGGTFSEKIIVCHWWKIWSAKISANSKQICFQKRVLLTVLYQTQLLYSLVSAGQCRLYNVHATLLLQVVSS